MSTPAAGDGWETALSSTWNGTAVSFHGDEEIMRVIAEVIADQQQVR
jgi:hypothetical protein